jgi:hypothetical protein
MRVCFRKSDGSYCDNGGSHVKYPGDEEFVEGGNVMGRFGGTPDDYIVVDTDEPRPWLKRYVNGKLVDDEEKLAATARQEEVQAEVSERLKSLRRKVKDRTATLDDALSLLEMQMGPDES